MAEVAEPDLMNEQADLAEAMIKLRERARICGDLSRMTRRAHLCWALAVPSSLMLLFGKPQWPSLLRTMWQSRVCMPVVLCTGTSCCPHQTRLRLMS